jgi:hypothetical protein
VSLVVALQAWGQSGTSSALAGNVTDTTGAAIPNAQVRAVEVNTGAVSALRSHADGRFLFLPGESRNLPR